MRLIGLETFAASEFHIHLYGKVGFRPAWTGISYSRTLDPTPIPDGVRTSGPPPDLSFIYPGLKVAGETEVTVTLGAGVVLTTDEGLAICHLEPTFQDKGVSFLPFVAARSRPAFDRLMGGAENLSHAAGGQSILTRVSGSAWAKMDALRDRGYREGEVLVRMKRGGNLDYDRNPSFYRDNWL